MLASGPAVPAVRGYSAACQPVRSKSLPPSSYKLMHLRALGLQIAGQRATAVVPDPCTGDTLPSFCGTVTKRFNWDTDHDWQATVLSGAITLVAISTFEGFIPSSLYTHKFSWIDEIPP